MASKLVESVPVTDPVAGRKCRVLFYEDGSVRFKLSRTPYVIEEAFVSGPPTDEAIVKLSAKPVSA